MATQTHNEIESKETNMMLWLLAIVALVAILAYAGYAIYYDEDGMTAANSTNNVVGDLEYRQDLAD